MPATFTMKNPKPFYRNPYSKPRFSLPALEDDPCHIEFVQHFFQTKELRTKLTDALLKNILTLLALPRRQRGTFRVYQMRNDKVNERFWYGNCGPLLRDADAKQLLF